MLCSLCSNGILAAHNEQKRKRKMLKPCKRIINLLLWSNWTTAPTDSSRAVGDRIVFMSVCEMCVCAVCGTVYVCVDFTRWNIVHRRCQTAQCRLHIVPSRTTTIAIFISNIQFSCTRPETRGNERNSCAAKYLWYVRRTCNISSLLNGWRCTLRSFRPTVFCYFPEFPCTFMSFYFHESKVETNVWCKNSTYSRSHELKTIFGAQRFQPVKYRTNIGLLAFMDVVSNR